MPPALSTYLDALRVLAAGTVLFGHALGWGTLAHDAVILFFVLSGYLIAYTANERDLTGTQYAVNRVARIATVALPAIVLGIAVDIYVRPLWPQGWPDFAPLDRMATSIGVCLTMTSYVWDNSYPCFSNGPYWSLTYEVWYYLLFGAAFYPKSARTRIVAGGAVLLLMGPKIAALLPCWLAGLVAYYIQKRWRPGVVSGSLFAIVPIIIYAAMLNFPLNEFVAIDVIGPVSIATGYMFHFSNAFLLDWFTAILFAAHILGGIGVLGGVRHPHEKLARPVKYFAGMTFSIYLFSAPLIKLVSAFLPVWAYHLPGPGLPLLVSVAAAGLAMAFSVVTEQQKDKARVFLNWLLSQSPQRPAVSRTAQGSVTS